MHVKDPQVPIRLALLLDHSQKIVFVILIQQGSADRNCEDKRISGQTFKKFGSKEFRNKDNDHANRLKKKIVELRNMRW